MMDQKRAAEYAKGKLERGELKSVAEANVEIVRMMGVLIVAGRLGKDVRSALSAGVKNGKIGHLPKKGLLPEAFFHPNARATALEMRQEIAYESIQGIKKVVV